MFKSLDKFVECGNHLGYFFHRALILNDINAETLGNMLGFYSVKSGHCQVHTLESPVLLGEVECAIALGVDETGLSFKFHPGDTFI